ncbi:MAG: permease-like cell division protein FtsX [Bacteroidota bacterium]|nr:permease-like cell division protein FtsX [Bacteroidota bacterium]
MGLFRGPRLPFTHALLSIVLALFVLGLYGVFMLTGRLILESARENLEYRVLLYPTADEQSVRALGVWLQQQSLVREVRYISPEEALANFAKSVGEDFVRAMEGVNPFPPMYRVRLRGARLSADSLKLLSSRVLEWEIVREIDYPLALLNTLEERARLVGWVGLGVGGVLLVAVYLLIFSTVRLAIFSRRLEIRTMELVGATATYIERPFILVGLFQGLVGALIAVSLIHLSLMIVDRYSLPLPNLLQDMRLGLVYGGLLILGALMGFLASKMAIRRFLHQTLEKII